MGPLPSGLKSGDSLALDGEATLLGKSVALLAKSRGITVVSGAAAGNRLLFSPEEPPGGPTPGDLGWNTIETLRHKAVEKCGENGFFKVFCFEQFKHSANQPLFLSGQNDEKWGGFFHSSLRFFFTNGYFCHLVGQLTPLGMEHRPGFRGGREPGVWSSDRSLQGKDIKFALSLQGGRSASSLLGALGHGGRAGRSNVAPDPHPRAHKMRARRTNATAIRISQAILLPAS